MVDASTIVDSATGIVNSVALANQDPHTLATLIPDLFTTTIVAGLGLMGAYVTRGAEGDVYEEPPPSRVFRSLTGGRKERLDYDGERRGRRRRDYDDALVPPFPEAARRRREYDDDLW